MCSQFPGPATDGAISGAKMEAHISATSTSLTNNNNLSQGLSNNATVVMNANVLPLFQLTSLTEDGDKPEFCPEKFGAGLGEAGVLQMVDTGRGLVQVVADGLNVGQLTLSSITGTGQVTLNGLSSNADLQQTALLAPGDSFSHSGAPLFEVQTETVADQSELTLTSPIVITASSGDMTATNTPPISAGAAISFDSESKMPKRRGGWPKGKKRKKEKESHAPKAPATAYVLFAMERRAAIKETNPEVMFVEVTKILGNEWSSMTHEEKQKYLDAAEADKKRYMEELKEYQHSEAYQNFLKRKKLKVLGSDEDSLGAEGQYGDTNTVLSELEEEGLYCKVCNQYFSSLHNRKEHMFGKQHLQAITSEFEKELQEETSLTPDLSHDLLTSESDQSLVGGTAFCPQRMPSAPLNIQDFIHDFMGKNLEREQEIRELKQSVHMSRVQNAELVQKCTQLKELETKWMQDVANLKAYQAALITQIDGLRMVPMLFDVINFYIDPKEEES